jgi:NAD+ synthetase
MVCVKEEPVYTPSQWSDNRPMKIALCQINTTVGDFEGNTARIEEFARRAAEAGAELAVFPELAIPSYHPKDLLETRSFVDRNLRALDSLTATSRDIAMVVGFVDRNPQPNGKALYNGAALLADGRVLARAYKTLLPTYDGFDETRHFQPSARWKPVNFRGLSMGLTICEDVLNEKSGEARNLYQDDPAASLVREGTEILINISASPFHLGKPALREAIVSRLARRLAVPVVHVNQVGGNDELIFDGSSFVTDPSGRVVVRLESFEEDMAVFNTSAPPSPENELLAGDAGAVRKALVLGIHDYMGKCGFEEVVVGLSGGIDSALVATLAVDALGPGVVHGVAMPSRYSSPRSLSDARALSRNLSIDLIEQPIDDIFQKYLDATAASFEGLAEDVTEENYQARIRGNLLMGFSNKFGWIVLSTGNKSELAVGYCTLYGDMSGGLSVLADVPKTLVYEIAEIYAESHIPRSIIDRPPSAELRPDQKDSDSLPPYDVLDRILKAYVEEGGEAGDIAAALGLDPGLVRSVISMVDRNEYKRRQAAPVLKVTSKAFGTGRRLPIARKYQS